MSHCPRCGAEFSCEMVDGPERGQAAASACWCHQLPPIAAKYLYDDNAHGQAQPPGCLCRDCLLAALSASSQGN